MAVVGLLAGCGGGPGRMAAGPPGPAVPNRVPIVLIPGIGREVAHVLRGGALVPFSGLALRTDGQALAHLGDPRFSMDGIPALEAPARLDRALRGTDVRGLQALIDHLIRTERYVRGDPDRPADKDYAENSPEDRQDRTRVASLFVLYYDWRRDLAESACVIAGRIARIQASTRAPRVHLVAHSLGGIVARYYLRYGGRDAIRDRDCPLGQDGSAAVNAPGTERVGRLALLGVPHRGSALAFRALLQDVSLFGVLALGIREAVFTMPLAWQLLPFTDTDGRVPLLVGENGEERIPLYALSTWVEQGWVLGDVRDPQRLRFVEGMLARPEAFHRSMAGRHPAEETVPRLVVGAGCRPTPVRAIATENGVRFVSRDQIRHPLFARTTAPGDGVVTAENAIGLPASPTLTSLTICTAHNAYLDHPDVLGRVVWFLLRENPTAPVTHG